MRRSPGATGASRSLARSDRLLAKPIYLCVQRAAVTLVPGCFAPSIVQFARSTVLVRRLLLLPGSVHGQQLCGGHRRLSSRKRVATFLAFQTKSDGRAES